MLLNLFFVFKLFFLKSYFYFIFLIFIFLFIVLFNKVGSSASSSCTVSYRTSLRFVINSCLSLCAYHVLIFFLFDENSQPFQIYYTLSIGSINLNFAVDNLSIFFLLLTSFIIPLCILIHYYWPLNLFLKIETLQVRPNYCFNISYQTSFNNFMQKSHNFLILLMLLYFFLIIFFTTLNLIVFYTFFELSVVPIFFIIGWFGSRANKIKAAYYIFFYTVIGSIPFLVGLVMLYSQVSSLDFPYLYVHNFDFASQKLFFCLFFIPFAVKVPIVPFHVWLPEAHVEAPTEGSVLLAGLLLKLGVYGLMRFLMPLFPAAFLFFSPLLYTLCLVSVLYTSLLIFCQIDLKKIIAYSSIAHMNFALLGLFSLSNEGVAGSVYIFYTHGIISSGLFICVGCLYSRFYTRLLGYYSGLTYYYPVFSIFFFFFVLGNISFPGTGSFVGEVMIILGLFLDNFFIGVFSLIGPFLCTIYSIVLFTRICFGIPTFYYLRANNFSKRGLHLIRLETKNFYLLEYLMMLILLVMMLFLGFFPNSYLNALSTVANYLNNINSSA